LVERLAVLKKVRRGLRGSNSLGKKKRKEGKEKEKLGRNLLSEIGKPERDEVALVL